MEQIWQLSEDVTLRIVNEIQKGVFSQAFRLPPEVDLAKQFGVSRNVIRECLARLEREGLVTRKHGIGTLINRHIVSSGVRLDLNEELIPTLEHAGKRAKTKKLHIRRGKAKGEIAEKLLVKPGDELIISERLIYADDRPAILCIDYISAASVTGGPYVKADFQPSVFEFLRKFCGVEVYMSLAELRAFPAQGKTAKSLEVAEGTPLFFLGEVGYNFAGKPVLYSEEYFIDGVVRHVILRKKI
jgi:GntR family transcriptional regulator